MRQHLQTTRQNKNHVKADQYLWELGNFPILPLRTRTRGPAYTLPALPPNTADIDVAPDSESYDCVDEILSLFRANVLFRNFEINGPADRMLIYGTLFVSECLGKVKPTMTARDAEKVSCPFTFMTFRPSILMSLLIRLLLTPLLTTSPSPVMFHSL